MRSATFLFLLAVATISAAQDTNFAAGPQYLITNNSTFLQPIATPSLSLSAPLPSYTGPGNEALPEPPSPFAGPPPQPDLTRIFWGEPQKSEKVRSENGNENENVGGNATEIEISSAPLPRPLPGSILNTGVTGMTTAQSLHELGFGVTLGETADFWKTHRPHAPHIYTNADIERLGSS
ncbi:MAG TPA: hypothetical protein VGM18_06445 [Candidatus Sulfotelmatobacter sp.]|jgi:hypothetical protein